MTNEQLQRYVEQLSLDVFSLPFRHKAYFNPRLKTTGGRYFLGDHHLDFNKRYIDDMKVFRGIVIHELCHYHLHLAGMGHRHQDQDFKEWLERYDGLRYSPRRQEDEKKSYLYECEKCSTLYRRKRRMNTERYRCGRCHGKIFYKSS
ncbi:SprT family protein [Exiguobacterium sp. OS-77]|uniref:SprT family protein n=1 Tax=Exiguobacterium sp. OS-77 TaxID=1241306 RepID=UPI000407CBB0|nr:SprT family protein [Exiguobacterium sp. OS-77]